MHATARCVLGFILLWSVTAAWANETALRHTPPPLGAKWTNFEKNTGSFGNSESELAVTRGEREWQGRKTVSFESVRGASLWDPKSGGLIAIIAANGNPVVTYASDWTFEFPLTVGKSWTKPVRFMTHANNRTVDYDVTCNVGEFGEVAVKAGRFKAFKVSCKNTIDTEEHFWYSAEMGFWIKLIQVRGAGNPAGVGTREVEIVSQSIRSN